MPHSFPPQGSAPKAPALEIPTEGLETFVCVDCVYGAGAEAKAERSLIADEGCGAALDMGAGVEKAPNPPRPPLEGFCC